MDRADDKPVTPTADIAGLARTPRDASRLPTDDLAGSRFASPGERARSVAWVVVDRAALLRTDASGLAGRQIWFSGASARP